MSETTTKQKSDQTTLGALWAKSSNYGEFFTGNLNLKEVGIDKEFPIVIFKNRYKDKETHPDFRIFLSKPKAGGVPTTKKTDASKPKSTPKPSAAVQEVPENDADIAF